MLGQHKFLRSLCMLLILAVSTPPLPLAAQTANTGGALSIPSADRFGGSSFGTKSRLGHPMQLPQDRPLPRTILEGPSYQIHVLGEVTFPGTYRVLASTRASEAITMAGGILARGSERYIQLRRKGQKTRIIDLMSFKMLGSLQNNPFLLDNDVIYVPLQKHLVQISGAIKRPDFYELRSRSNLFDAVELAGGFSSGTAISQPAKIIRFEDEEKTVIEVPLDKEDMKAFRLRMGDIIVIPHILTKNIDFDYNTPILPGDSDLFYPSFEERVFVIGAVFQPGPQPYSPYYSIREYLTLAGGLTRLAKKNKVFIIDTLGKKTKADIETAINPGDTIVIPERYLPPERMATLILSITATALTITTTVLALTR